MPKEFDLAGLASVSGWLKLKQKRANIPEGMPCANCETALRGPFCHVCGQFAENMHRSIFKLCFEFFEGVYHVDGRVWQTLPTLFFKPGVLTRDYLAGKRAPQIPPFRLFLLALLLLFVAGDWVRSQNAKAGADPLGFVKQIPKSSPQTAAPVVDLDFLNDKAPTPATKTELDNAKVHITSKLFESSQSASQASKWLRQRLRAIQEDPERFLLILEIWAYRVAVLALPLNALLLTILFIFQRRFFVYDHLVFSTHSLTFHLFLLMTILLLTLVIGTAAWWLALASPFHFWTHMRKVYATSIFGTLVRMGFLGFGTFVGFTLLALAWLIVGVNAMA